MNNREIGLFFHRKYIYDPINIAEQLKSSFPDLGEAVILPVDESNNNPVFIFDKNSNFTIYASLSNIIVKLGPSKYPNIKGILGVILNIFSDEKIEFTRLGIVNTIVLGEKEKNLFINNAFEAKQIIMAKEIELSYFQNIDYKDKILNCWKRYISNNELFYVVVDINTQMEDIFEINIKNIMKFIEFALEYMEQSQLVKLY